MSCKMMRAKAVECTFQKYRVTTMLEFGTMV